MAIKFGVLPGDLVEVELAEGEALTVGQLVERQYPQTPQGYEARVNGQVVQADEVLHDGDLVTLLGAISGAR